MDKLKLAQKVGLEALGMVKEETAHMKMDVDMMTFIIINGFFFTVLLFLQLVWYFIVNYVDTGMWWAVFSGIGLFYLFLLPSHDEQLLSEGIISNYAGIVFRPRRIHAPRSEADLQELIRDISAHKRKVRVYGNGNGAFNSIGFSKDIISMKNFAKISVDERNKTATVEAGVTLGALAAALWEKGLCLGNLGWLSSQTVGGAIQSNVHASSKNQKSLAASVTEITIVDGNGSKIVASAQQETDIFNAARNGLGVLGVVVSVTFACESAFQLKEVSKIATVEEAFRAWKDSRENNDYFSFWWIPYVNQVNMVIGNKTTETEAAPQRNLTPKERIRNALMKLANQLQFVVFIQLIFYGCATIDFVAKRMLGYLVTLLKSRTTIKPCKETLFDNFFAMLPRWNEAEYFVPVEATQTMLDEIQAMIQKGGWFLNFPCRVSFVAADNLWLSETSGRDSASIRIGMLNRLGKWKQLLPKLDSIARKYDARPNWAKDHQMTKADMMKLYPNWNLFLELRKRMDPNDIFLNEHLATFFSSE